MHKLLATQHDCPFYSTTGSLWLAAMQINAAALASVAAIIAPPTPDYVLAFAKSATAPIVTGRK